ncbi:helix-turn-helix domain-containing protein [Streptomyces pseudogriseolus]|uniref:helix-turn-helix domain-containing protein n=1 Tax=Streptomyces pseudogriseolus TaxID=36817 RepID=UPI003FA2CE75
MTTPEPAAHAGGETFAQVLAALKDEYGTNDSRIAERIGAHVSTVNNWAHGKSQPRPAAIRALAREFPKFTEERLFAAVGKRAPAPLPPDKRAAVLEVFDRLTEEQQEMLLIQASAVADTNERQP